VVSVVASRLIDGKKDFSGGVMVVRDLTRLLRLERRLEYHQGFDRIVGNSEAIQKVLLLAGNLANVQTSVLITGESGTGKELVADAIHAMGDRSQKLMVKVNCAALTETLLESELFGHVRGAFTGAVQDKIGRFQKADGGTIFLDEIGEISPSMQLRFLRVLEQMEIERVGDSTPIRIDVRVIAATNRDLRQKMLAGEFREDLFYRLNVVEIRMPPLRDRRGDIPLLVKHFLDLFNKKFEKNITSLSPDVNEILMKYPWPGNVRELKNTLEHAFVLCNRNVITAGDLPPDFAASSMAVSQAESNPAGVEERQILQALTLSSGNKSRAAKLLGISRRTLYRKIDQFKMPPE
jgi:transcriptional regulator with PAS, ATPase and Fis domain